MIDIQGRLPFHALDYYSIFNFLLVMVQFLGSGNHPFFEDDPKLR